jgi:hypothetical protein
MGCSCRTFRESPQRPHGLVPLLIREGPIAMMSTHGVPGRDPISSTKTSTTAPTAIATGSRASGAATTASTFWDASCFWLWPFVHELIYYGITSAHR